MIDPSHHLRILIPGGCKGPADPKFRNSLRRMVGRASSLPSDTYRSRYHHHEVRQPSIHARPTLYCDGIAHLCDGCSWRSLRFNLAMVRWILRSSALSAVTPCDGCDVSAPLQLCVSALNCDGCDVRTLRPRTYPNSRFTASARRWANSSISAASSPSTMTLASFSVPE